MRRYIFIGIGGFLGANIRFLVRNIPVINNYSHIYLGTIIINIIGCYAIALFLNLAFEIWELNSDFRLGISTGLIGAFTTFSTLCRETTVLFIEGSAFLSFLYLLLSVAGGFISVYIGDITAKKIIKIKTISDVKEDIL